MSYRELCEGRDVFVRRLVRLLRYVAADPSLNMYYCFGGFYYDKYDRLSVLRGIKTVVLDRWVPEDGGDPNFKRFDNLIGVLELGEEGLADLDPLVDGLCRFSSFCCCVVVTDEPKFLERIVPILSRWCECEIRREDVREEVCSHDRSMMFNCAFVRKEVGVIYSTYSTKSEELVRVFADPV